MYIKYITVFIIICFYVAAEFTDMLALDDTMFFRFLCFQWSGMLIGYYVDGLWIDMFLLSVGWHVNRVLC